MLRYVGTQDVRNQVWVLRGLQALSALLLLKPKEEWGVIRYMGTQGFVQSVSAHLGFWICQVDLGLVGILHIRGAVLRDTFWLYMDST